MVKYLHVVSVGTSLLRNFERDRMGEAEALGVRGWWALPFNHPQQSEAVGRAFRGDPLFKALLNYLESDPRRASAELNAFLSYVEAAGHAPPGEVGVILYSTDTGTCYLCASVIQEFLRRRGYALASKNPVRVEGLGTSEEAFEDGLANLLDRVARLVARNVGKGVRVYVCAAGGFKAETTFMALAAAVLGATAAYYIHETFRRVVELPLPPLNLDGRLRDVIARVVEYGGAVPPDVFEGVAREAGLDPQALIERGLFIVKGGVRPRRWLRLLASLGR